MDRHDEYSSICRIVFGIREIGRVKGTIKKRKPVYSRTGLATGLISGHEVEAKFKLAVQL